MKTCLATFSELLSTPGPFLYADACMPALSTASPTKPAKSPLRYKIYKYLQSVTRKSDRICYLIIPVLYIFGCDSSPKSPYLR